MPISFPSSPTTGQTYTYNNKTWTYNGTTWDANTTASIATAVAPITYNASTQAVGLTRTFNTTSATDKGLVIKGSTSQTADLLQLQNSSGTVLGNVAADGSASFTNNNAAGKNVIINGGFDFWQRGTSFTNPNSGVFTADRWTNLSDGTGATRTVTQQAFTPGNAIAGYEATYFYRFNQSVAGTGGTYNTIQTRIEDVRTLAGQTATFSFWMKADTNRTIAVNVGQNFGSGGSAGVNTYLAAVSVTTSWQRFSMTFTMPSIAGKTVGAGSYVYFDIYMPINTTSTIDLWGVQLEAGSVATPFSRAGGTIQGELAACQRYYFRETSAGSYWQFGMGNSENTAQAKIIINLPVPMRITPSAVESTTVSNYTCVNTSFTTTTSIAIDGQYCTNRQMVLIIGGTFTAGLPQRFVANNNSTAYIGFSAEL